METKIISIDIKPNVSNQDTCQNAGTMWEHNATALVFNIDSCYVGDYKYYLEYRSLIGTKVRTEYLSLNTENNTVTYIVPVTMSSLKGVECYFNIVSIDEDGNTNQIIKPYKFYLEFDFSPDTDNSLCKVNDFSINALLEAIRLGTFKGDKGETGEKGDKGDKGETGEKGEVTMAYANTELANAIKKSVSGNPIIIDNASPLPHNLKIKTIPNANVYVRGKNLIPFDNKSYNNGQYKSGETYTINGVSFTINEDGSIYVNGTANTNGAILYLYYVNSVASGNQTVFMSTQKSAETTDCRLRLITANGVNEELGYGRVVENVDMLNSNINICVMGNATVDLTIYPQIEFGNVASDFVNPVGSSTGIADENGNAEIVSVGENMSVFGDGDIECAYNCDTQKCIKESIPNYRVLVDITLTEDVASITIDKDLDGKPFNIKSVYIDFSGEVDTDASNNQKVLGVYLNKTEYQWMCYRNVTSTAKIYWYCEGQRKIKTDDLEVWVTTQPQATLYNEATASTTLATHRCKMNTRDKSTVTFAAQKATGGTYANFKAGSRIIIAGIDDEKI